MENPLLRQAESVPTTNRYEALGLTDNPFPSDPVLSPATDNPRQNGSIYCEELTRDRGEQLQRLLIASPENYSPVAIAFLMDHAQRRGRGIGQSAFLRYQCRTINRTSLPRTWQTRIHHCGKE